MVQAATIKDVAQLAGCGVATVSRVLNNTGPASAEMRDRVLTAVEQLDFHFSEVGRSLQSSTTKTIGCVVPSIENPVYADAVQGAQEVFLNADYQMLLVCTNYNAHIETRAIRTLIAKQVDGILLTVADAQNSEGLDLVRNRQLPHSLLFNEAPTGQANWSVGDHAAAAAPIPCAAVRARARPSVPREPGRASAPGCAALSTVGLARPRRAAPSLPRGAHEATGGCLAPEKQNKGKELRARQATPDP